MSRRLLLAAPALLTARAVLAQTALRVGDQRGGAQALMKAAAALDDLPYKVEWSQFAAAAPLMEALNANAVDTAFAGDAPVTFALATGLPAQNRGGHAGNRLPAPPSWCTQGSAIRTPQDLRGKRIATNRGSIGHALVLAAAEKFGWTPAESKITNLLPADAARGGIVLWRSRRLVHLEHLCGASGADGRQRGGGGWRRRVADRAEFPTRAQRGDCRQAG